VHAIDFRSDTITQPTAAMRDAMAGAEVGDDVFGDDPTVNALQELAAERMGKPAALFVPSGTMANQIAAWVHTGRSAGGGQIVCDAHCHMALYEGGAAAMLSGATLRTLTGAAGDGSFTADEVRPHVFPDDPHFAATRCIAVENTHNWAGGTVWDPDTLIDVAGFAHARGIKIHMDGARIFNAAVATGAPPTTWTECTDSVMFCLSKGLSAPVGSVLCGSVEFIAHAHKVRKWLGGGMRQAGVLAAAGIVAMQQMVDRLAEDHATADRLAAGLAKVSALKLLAEPDTNIVYVDVAKTGLAAEDFVTLAGDVGVRCLPRDTGSVVRFVTHRHVTPDDAAEAVRRLAAVLADGKR
jgi:threonine aldolase